MTDSAAPETPDDQPEKGKELARRALTPTEQWLSRQTGVEVVEAENGRMISLSRELAARVIPLCPVSQVVQLDRNWTPVPRVSWLTPGVDTYKQGNVKVGEENGRAIYADVHAPNAAALAKVATLMGIETVPGGVQWSRPVDTDRGIKCTVTARMRGADGQWKYVTRSKTVRFDDEDEAMELDLREKWEDDKAIWESAKRKKDADPSTRLSGAEYNVWRKYGPKGLTDTYVRRQVLQSREHIDAKALADDAMILTPAGFVRMDSLEVGDLVVGGDGRPTPVLAVWPQGERQLFAVEFTDGTVVECDDDHLWSATCHNWAGRPGAMWRTKPLRELRALSQTLHVPLPSGPVEFLPVPEPMIDPWLVGALLGDGNLTRRGMIRFAAAEADMVRMVEEALPEDAELVCDGGLHYRIRCREYVLAHKAGPGRKAHALLAWAREVGLHGQDSHTKRVPHALLYGSPATRLAVLQGMADTDGTVARLAQAAITTMSRGLADDIAFLARSLGGRARIDAMAAAWRVALSIPGVVPFRLPRKAQHYAEQLEQRTDRRDWRTIKSITPSRLAPARCITVAAEDGLFLADGFVVTHNCETKAFNRCVRALSGIRSYSETELRQKPLFTIGYFLTPNYSDPNVLGFLELVGRQSSGDLYGDGAVEDMPALPTVTDPPPPLPQGSVLDGEAGTWLDDDPGEGGEDDEPPRSLAGDGDVIDADQQGHVITDPPPGGASDEADDWDAEPAAAGQDDPEPEDAIVAPDDDWTFPTPEKGTSPVAGRSMSDLAASPAGLALLRRATAKMRNADRKALAEAWIAYGEANPS